MKTAALLPVDLSRGPLGTRCRLADELNGVPVLRRTIARLRACRSLSSIVVISPPDQRDALRALVGDAADVETSPHWIAPHREICRASRLWSPDAWRGGIGGLSWFDEDAAPAAWAELAARLKLEAVAVVPAAAALVAPPLVDAIVAHHRENAETYRLTFSQAPPGLGTVVFAPSLLAELAAAGQPPGAILAYQPDQPQPDWTGKPACYRPAACIVETSGRLLADTTRGFRRMDRMLRDGAPDWSAERIADTLAHERSDDPIELPDEIELELTTDDPLAGHTTLRPRGGRVGRRGPLALDTVAAVAEQLGDVDDVRIVLGGFGEPALHPDFARIVSTLRKSPALAIAVRTSGLAGDDRFEDALFGAPVDVVIVTLDAAAPETYVRVHGVDAFERVRARIERWSSMRQQRRQVRPLIVTEFVKTTANLDDMEAFYDVSIRSLAGGVIAGPSHYAGQFPDLRVTAVTPPRRIPCRQLQRRLTVLADGAVASCDQDFAGRQPLGRLPNQSLPDIWHGEHARRLRADHRHGSLTAWPLCPRCEEWHRP